MRASAARTKTIASNANTTRSATAQSRPRRAFPNRARVSAASEIWRMGRGAGDDDRATAGSGRGSRSAAGREVTDDDPQLCHERLGDTFATALSSFDTQRRIETL